MQTLHFYPDSRPGFTRQRRGRGFSYLAPDGTRVADTRKRDALAALAIPPAYSDVWISPRSDGHLQASGRDARSRKQYMYHPAWSRLRQAQKFDALADIGAALPRLRRWIARNLAGAPEAHDTALATALALIDRCSLRVGDRAYTAQNGSYAATTLKPEHVEEQDGALRLCFPAKGGRVVSKALPGSRLIEILNRYRRAKAQHLIYWKNGRGRRVGLSGRDINMRLADLLDKDVSAKDIRTWNGTHAAFMAAATAPEPLPIAQIADNAARRLHNTATIARNNYIHPVIIAHREDIAGATPLAPATDGSRKGEAELLRFLEKTPKIGAEVRLVE